MCGLNVTALIKGEERYVFLWRDDALPDLFRTLGRFASDPELSLNWYDAANISLEIRRRSKSPLQNCGALSEFLRLSDSASDNCGT